MGGTGTRKSHGTTAGIGSNAARPGGSTSLPLPRAKKQAKGQGPTRFIRPKAIVFGVLVG